MSWQPCPYFLISDLHCSVFAPDWDSSSSEMHAGGGEAEDARVCPLLASAGIEILMLSPPGRGQRESCVLAKRGRRSMTRTLLGMGEIGRRHASR
jgi:hypothetical protein